jgi:hypothetical protein
LDDFSDEYIERVSSTTCPDCGLLTPLDTLLARFENDHLRLDFPVIPKPLPVILYLKRFPKDQPETFAWIKNWLAREGHAGVAKLQEMLDQRRAEERAMYGEERDSYGVLEELSELIFEWRFFNEIQIESKEPMAPSKRAALARIKEWVAQHGQAGETRIQEILSSLAPSRREEFSELLWEWRIEEELRLENSRQRTLKGHARKRPAP